MAARTRSAFGLGLVLMALVGGCSAFNRHQDKKIPQYGVIDPNQPRELREVTLPRHMVRPPDELRISVRPAALGFEDHPVVVQSDGLIDLGFFGELYVNGMTIPEIEAHLRAQLGAYAATKQITEPVQVSVRLVDGTKSRRFYVLGTVQSPGSFPITGHEMVLDAILQAGLKSYSLPDKAYLIRPHPEGAPDQVLSIDWSGITQRGDTTTNYQLMPGDRIYVPGGKPPSLLRSLAGG